MTDQPQKQGLPRGCVVGLIVAGALLVLVIALFVVCRIYQDDLVKFSIKNTLGGMQKAIATSPIQGVNSADVDSISANFSARFDTTTKIDYDRLQPLVLAVQTAATSGSKFDSALVSEIVSGLVSYYPDLERFRTVSQVTDSSRSESVPVDSVDSVK